jgi:hypothetical protein
LNFLEEARNQFAQLTFPSRLQRKHNFLPSTTQVSPREEPSRNGASDDHVLAAQVELARYEEEEQVIPPSRLKSICQRDVKRLKGAT